MKLKQITEARYSGNECPSCGFKGGTGPREVGEPALDNFVVSFNSPPFNEEPHTNDATGPDIKSLAEFVPTGDPGYPMIWVPKKDFDKELKQWTSYDKSIVGLFIDGDDYKTYGEKSPIAFMWKNK